MLNPFTPDDVDTIVRSLDSLCAEDCDLMIEVALLLLARPVLATGTLVARVLRTEGAAATL